MDPFEVLGIRPDASPTEVRQAFAVAVRTAHPDAGGSAESASQRIAELIQARDDALTGRRRPAATAGRVVGYQRARGWPRLVGLVVAGLSWGRPKRSGRNLH